MSEHTMKAVVGAAVSIAVAVGVYVTKDLNAMWGLSVLVFFFLK